jgi:hypothetical protein
VWEVIAFMFSVMIFMMCGISFCWWLVMFVVKDGWVLCLWL